MRHIAKVDMKIGKRCEYCKSIFYVYPCRQNAIYCSLGCRKNGMHKKSYIKECLICNKNYKVYERDKNSKYCSNKCKRIGRNISIKCAYCGKIFYVRKSHAHYKIYCSKECQNNDYKIRFNNLSYNRKDNNHDEIVNALLDAGAKVLDLSLEKYGCPDIAIGWNGKLILAEIKSAKGKLSSCQKKFFNEWNDYAVVVRSKKEALSLLSVL